MLKGWKNFKEDFGLGKFAIIIMGYDIIFFIGLLFFGIFSLKILAPVAVAGILLALRPFFIPLKGIIKVLILFGLSLFFTLYNYNFIAELDGMVHFRRLDIFFAQFDMLLFKMPVADYLDKTFPFNTSLKVFFNDLLMVNYILFYFLGLYIVIFYYLSLHKEHKYRVATCLMSFMIFMGLNHISYMLVPVSGPQYYQKGLFTTDIPFTWIGRFWFDVVLKGQGNLIDCFPSGHFGVALMTTLWAYRINRWHHYFSIFVSICMFFATMKLRYHYSLDLIFSPFLVILAYLISFKLFSRTDDVDISPYSDR